MKINKHHIQFRFKSFATRLSTYIIIFVGLIFTLISWLFYSYTRDTIINDTMANTHQAMNTMVAQIEDKLNNTDLILKNNLKIVEENISNPDELLSIIKSIVTNNDGIVGSSIAFEPGYKGKNRFMLYAYGTKKDNVYTKIFTDEDYNYLCMDWYLISKRLKKSIWNEPYYDNGAGNMIMTTYSLPLKNSEGEIYAIITADISLEEFSNMITKLQPFDNSYSFMLSRNGYYLTHKRKDRILNETIFSNAAEQNNKDYEEIGRAMILGKNGTKLFDNDGVESYAFYTSIPDIGWSVCCVVPSDTILAELNNITRTIIILFIIGITLLFITTNRVIKKITKPIVDFAHSASRISEGNFETALPIVKSHDEVSILRDSLDHMRISLHDYIEKLTQTTVAKERIENELHIAREIQMGMLPKIFPPFPERNDVDLHALLIPAKEVGGDLYDFFIKDKNLFFSIGDVSGKGVPASLFMAITSSLFRTLAQRENNSLSTVEAMNNAMCENNYSNMFVTLIVGILNIENGEMQICNAGHNHPLLIDNNGNCKFLPLKSNIPIGLIPNFKYEIDNIKLDSQCKLLFYTDGVTEAENKNKVLYGEKRLKEVASVNYELDVNSFIDTILKSVKAHVGNYEQSDDITMLMINYKYSNNKKSVHKSLVISNKKSEISKLENIIDEIGYELNLPISLRTNINVALEEAVSNIILYAYPTNQEHEIHLNYKYENQELTFELIDNGIPFDPTKIDDPDLTLDINERQVGGLGIMLIKKIMDVVLYERINDENHLTLKKYISK